MGDKKSRRVDNIALLIAIIFLITCFFIGNHYIYVDSDNYVNRAKNLIENYKFSDTQRPPGYPFIIGIFGFIINKNYFFAARSISIFFSALLVLFSYKLAKFFFSKGYALLIQILVTFNCVFLLHSFRIYTDLMFASLCIIFLYYLIKIIHKKLFISKHLFILGILFGFAYLTRFNGILLLPCLIFILFIKSKHKNKLKLFIFFILGFLTISSPWLIINFIQHGNPFFNESWRNLGVDLYSPGEWRMKWILPFSSIWDTISHNKRLFFKHLITEFKNTIDKITRDHGIPILKGFWIIGLILFIISHRNIKGLVIFIFLLSFITIQSMFHYLPRFYLQFNPLLVMFSINILTFLSNFEKRINKKEKKTSLFRVSIIILILVIIGISIFAISKCVQKSIRSQPVLEVEAAKFIEKNYNTSSQIKIISSNEYIKNHINKSKIKIRRFRSTTNQTILKILLFKEIDLVLIGENSLDNKHYLFNTSLVYPFLNVIYSKNEPYKVIVYKVNLSNFNLSNHFNSPKIVEDFEEKDKLILSTTLEEFKLSTRLKESKLSTILKEFKVSIISEKSKNCKISFEKDIKTEGNRSLKINFKKEGKYSSYFIQYSPICLLENIWTAYNFLEFDIYSKNIPLNKISLHIANLHTKRLLDGNKYNIKDFSTNGEQLKKWHHIKINFNELENQNRNNIKQLQFFVRNWHLNQTNNNIIYLDNIKLSR